MTEYVHQDRTGGGLEQVDPGKCALIVIDELGEVAGTPMEATLLAPTLKTARMAEAARANGIPVIFANDAHFEGIDHELELWGRHGIAGSDEAQPSPELNMQKGDYVIEKPKYSAFFQTRLRSLLQDLGVNTLVLAGFDTNICVQHTAADAYFNGFKIVLVKDATETFLIGTQEGGLNYMQKCYAAEIVSADAVVALFEGKE